MAAGPTAEQLRFRADPEANTIAWLVWHLTRIQDDHVAEVAGTEQVWTSQGWAARFGVPFDPRDTGYGHRSDEVGAVRVESGSCWWATTTPSTSGPSATWNGSATPTSTGSWTGPGTRR